LSAAGEAPCFIPGGVRRIAAGSELLVVAAADQPVARAPFVVRPTMAPGPTHESDEVLAAVDGESGLDMEARVSGPRETRNSQGTTLGPMPPWPACAEWQPAYPSSWPKTTAGPGGRFPRPILPAARRRCGGERTTNGRNACKRF